MYFQVGGDDEATRATATTRQGLAEGAADPAGHAGGPPVAVPVTAQDPPQSHQTRLAGALRQVVSFLVFLILDLIYVHMHHPKISNGNGSKISQKGA